jgi:carbamoyltransferase
MRVLGLAAFQRDSSAALCVDGELVAAAQEERFSRKLADHGLPRRAARECLRRAGLEFRDLDALVFFEKPLRKFERTLAAQLHAFPRSARTFSDGLFLWLGDRLWIRARLAEEFGVEPRRVQFVEHARAHAALAFHSSGCDEAAVLVVDDFGEWATTTLARGRGTQLETLAELHFPHSLGLWYSAFTQFLGLEPGLDEARLEALARWGEPRFEREVAATVPELGGGAYRIDERCFRFAFDGERLFERELERRLAPVYGPPRAAGSALRIARGAGKLDGDGDGRDADLAASVQRVLEARVLALARELHARTGCATVCLGGEVFRNRSLVARLAADGPFEHVTASPAVGEAGAAAGAALEYSRQSSRAEGAPRRASAASFALGAPLDEELDDGDGALNLESDEHAVAALAEALRAGRTAAWVRGPLELGHASVSQRLILAAAAGSTAREDLLGALQRAEPCAPVRVLVPSECASEWIHLAPAAWQPAHVGACTSMASDALRAFAPSCVAPDGAVWAQLVARESDAPLHALLLRLGAAVGAPLALAADFHLRGQPLVRTAAEALDAYRRSSLDVLVVGARLYGETRVT